MAIVDVNHSQTIEEVLFKVGKGGSGGGRGLIVNAAGDNATGIFTLDKTFSEILDAFVAGNNVYIFSPQSSRPPVTESQTPEELFQLIMSGGLFPFVVSSIHGSVQSVADGMAVRFTIIANRIVEENTTETNEYYVVSDTVPAPEDPSGYDALTRIVIENTWGEYPSTDKDQGEAPK